MPERDPPIYTICLGLALVGLAFLFALWMRAAFIEMETFRWLIK